MGPRPGGLPVRRRLHSIRDQHRGLHTTSKQSPPSIRRSRHQCIACKLYSFRSVETRKVLDSRVRANPAVVALRVKDCSIPVPPPCVPSAPTASKLTLGINPVAALDATEVAVFGRLDLDSPALVGGGLDTGDFRTGRRSGADGLRGGEAGEATTAMGTCEGEVDWSAMLLLPLRNIDSELEMEEERARRWRRSFFSLALYRFDVCETSTGGYFAMHAEDLRLTKSSSCFCCCGSDLPSSSKTTSKHEEADVEVVEDTLNSDEMDDLRRLMLMLSLILVQRGGQSSGPVIEDRLPVLLVELDRLMRSGEDIELSGNRMVQMQKKTREPTHLTLLPPDHYPLVSWQSRWQCTTHSDPVLYEANNLKNAWLYTLDIICVCAARSPASCHRIRCRTKAYNASL